MLNTTRSDTECIVSVHTDGDGFSPVPVKAETMKMALAWRRLDRPGSVWYARGSVASGNNSVVECDLAKVEVAGSNPVSRSKPPVTRSELPPEHTSSAGPAYFPDAPNAPRSCLTAGAPPELRSIEITSKRSGRSSRPRDAAKSRAARITRRRLPKVTAS